MPIKFGRPGNEEQISTSRDKLLMLRAQHAIDNGQRVPIGNRTFLMVLQQGSVPAFVFFEGDLAQRLARGDISAANETFCVKNMRRVSAGVFEQMAGPLPIGEVGGRYYDMVRNFEGDFEVRLRR